MGGACPRLFADERGVWCEARPGQPYGIEWDEIVSVGGHKLDGVTEAYTVVELDFDYGEFVELQADSPGFSQVVHAITARLPGIAADWFQQIERLQLRESPITVWRRA
jgi:hypothetical protein